MGSIPENVLEDIRARCDIVDLIGSYLQLKRAGSAFKALCPFHKEKTPSFTVNPQRQIFHCFGCGAGGNVFRFVMDYEGVDFLNAVKMLARRAGVTLTFDEAESGGASNKDRLFQVVEAAAAFYHQVLLEHPTAAAARAYLRNRAFDGDAVRRFQLGYAPESYAALRQWAASKKFTAEQLETVGLTARGESNEPYARFRNRLMIPIADEIGRTIGFTARVLRKEDHPAKYVNSPETPLFHKSRVLYGIDRARRAILDRREAILCEGQIDTMRCHLAGVENVVAAQGTALTEEHARLLKRYADNIVILLDADKAGQNAAMRASEIFLAAGLSVRVAVLPEGEDPDSLLLAHGAEALQPVLARAVSAVEFQADVLMAREETGGEAAQRRVARAVLETISRAPGAVQREQLLRQASARLHLSEDALRADLRAQVRKPGRAAPEPPPPDTEPAAEHPLDEVALAELLIAQPEQRELVRAYLPLAYLTDPLCRTLIEGLLADDGREAWMTAPEGLPADRYDRLVARAAMSPRRVMGQEFSVEKAAQDLILSIWRRHLIQEREVLRRREEASPPDQRDLLALEAREITMKITTLAQGWERARPLLEL